MKDFQIENETFTIDDFTEPILLRRELALRYKDGRPEIYDLRTNTSWQRLITIAKGDEVVEFIDGNYRNLDVSNLQKVKRKAKRPQDEPLLDTSEHVGKEYLVYHLKGHPILIDEEDKQLIEDYHWHLLRSKTRQPKFKCRETNLLLGHMLLSTDAYIVTFKNHNTSDYRKSNLIPFTRSGFPVWYTEQKNAGLLPEPEGTTETVPIPLSDLMPSPPVDTTRQVKVSLPDKTYQATIDLGSKVHNKIKEGIDIFGSTDAYLAYLVMKEMKEKVS